MANRREIQAEAHVWAFNAHRHERTLAENFAKAVASQKFAYARCQSAGGSAFVVAYGHDANSPSGVTRIGSCLDFNEAVAIMDAAGRPFPLSPTEGLNKSGATAH